VVSALAAACDEVLVCPMLALDLPDVPADPWPAKVRVSPGLGVAGLADALAGALERAHAPAADDGPRRLDVGPRLPDDPSHSPVLLWVCRPHNLAEVAGLRARRPDLFAGVRIVYDAEAVFALRDLAMRELASESASEVQARRLLRRELQPAEIASHVAAISERERAAIAGIVPRPVALLRHPAVPAPTPTPFASRHGALFFGALRAAASPNADSLRYFVRDVLPAVAAHGVGFEVAGVGADRADWIHEIATSGMRVLGPVADPATLFGRVRVVVAPTRYGAGIPLKVIEAARHGAPVVATALVAAQLGWRDGEELLVGDTPQRFAEACIRLHEDEALWTRLRENALAAIRRDYDPATFQSTVRRMALGDAAT
jgi:hypothetical protein